jgi:predicted dehydrogenase
LRKITVVLVGAGDRANSYSRLSKIKPEKMQIVGIVEPDPIRKKLMRESYGVPKENCFLDLDTFLKRDKFADAVINGTMDELHVKTSIPILRKGYDMLLEKPFCTNEREMRELEEVVKETGRKVMICHVLRYTPFYSSIKRHVLDGEIGDIVSMEFSEHVSHHHFGVSYIRGKWANESKCGSPILLAKSCHDIDLMMWFKNGVKPIAVSSLGGDYQFRPERKPKGAGTNCFCNCPPEVEKECIYSARKNYIEPRLRWQSYVCRALENGEINEETVRESLKQPDNSFGRCMWDCKHDILDNQTVSIKFEDGTSAVFNLVGGSTRSQRKIHLIGTKGEIQGEFESSKYVIKKVDQDGIAQEKEYDVNITGDMDGEFGGHGGGDLRLAEDFVDWLAEDKDSISRTDLENSIYSHLTVFRAEKARKNGTVERVF